MLEPYTELYWKHRDRDGPQKPVVAGFGHQFFPQALIAALGLDAMDLLIGGSEDWQTKGIDYLTPTVCVYARQMVGFFEAMRGEGGIDLPKPAAVVQTNFCSGDYHSLEVINRHFGVTALKLPVPYHATPQAFTRLVDCMKGFVTELAAISGTEYDPEALLQALDRQRQLSAILEDFARMDVVGAERLQGYYEIALAPWEQKLDVASAIIEAGRRSIEEKEAPQSIIVLTGSPVFVGDRFHLMLDALGTPVRFYDYYFADQQAMRSIPREQGDLKVLKAAVDFSDPIQVFAAYYLDTLAPERMVGGRETHLDRRVKQVLQYSAFLPGERPLSGVVSMVLKFCDVFGTDRAAFKTQLQDRYHVPVLDIERDYSASSAGQISTRIEAFNEMLVADRHESE